MASVKRDSDIAMSYGVNMRLLAVTLLTLLCAVVTTASSGKGTVINKGLYVQSGPKSCCIIVSQSDYFDALIENLEYLFIIAFDNIRLSFEKGCKGIPYAGT